MTTANDSEIPPAGPGAAFRTTRWSDVVNAGNPSSPLAAAALNTLCQTYWYPIYAYLRRDGKDKETAEDLTQGFFARLLRLNSLAQVQREKGRFRSFLLASLKHFVRDEQVRAHALIRGGGKPLLSLDDTTGEDRYQLEPADDLDPEKLYERRWVLTLLAQVKARLIAEYQKPGKVVPCERLVVIAVGDQDAPPYAEIAAELDMTVQAVKNAVSARRQRYRELVREEVANTVGNPAEVDEELRHLITVISG